jgi:hypothetical protein
MAVRFLHDVQSGSPYAQVINMAHIELDQLLGCSADELITLVTPMSASNCEQYARAILGLIGGPSFEQLMMRILQTAVAKGVGPPPSNPDTYYFAVRELFPHVAKDSDVVGRLVLLTMLAGTLRLEAHRSQIKH